MTETVMVDDRLIDGLSYKMPNSASYILKRRMVSFQSVGANEYRCGTGSRIIKFVLSNNESWLDPSTLLVQIDVVNENLDANKKLRFVSNMHSCFERIVLKVGSVTIEDISDAHRVSQMMNFLGSKNKTVNDLAMSHGHEFHESAFNTFAALPNTYTAGVPSGTMIRRKLNELTYPGIKGGDFETVCFSLNFGLLKTDKYLPLQFMPLTIELFLVNDMKLPLLSFVKDTATIDTTDAGTNYAKYGFTKENSSFEFKLRNAEIKCDLLDINPSFAEQYTSHLRNSSITIPYENTVSQMATITGQNPCNVMISRSVSKLDKIFISFEKDGLETFASPGAKLFRTFYSPQYAENSNMITVGEPMEYIHVASGEYKINLSISGRQLIESTITSHSELYSKLVSSLASDITRNHYHSFDINPKQFRSSRHITCFNLKRAPDHLLGSGLDIRGGSQLNIKCEFLDTSRMPDRMHIVIVNEALMHVRSNGVDIEE